MVHLGQVRTTIPYRILDKIRLDYDVLYHAKEYSDRISSLTITFFLTRMYIRNLVSL